QPPVGQFTVAHPLAIKRQLVQPPARAVLGLANPQPTKLSNVRLGYHSAHQILGRISMILVTQLFGCPNNWVTGLPFGGLGIGEAKDCPGWRLDQPALDNWQNFGIRCLQDKKASLLGDLLRFTIRMRVMKIMLNLENRKELLKDAD
ncbi:unnamed protein product, partial [Notodromas monacha]